MQDFLENLGGGTFVEGIFRLSAPLAQLDALCILLFLRPELCTNELLLRASAVTVACVLKRVLGMSSTPILSVDSEDPVNDIDDPVAKKILHRLVKEGEIDFDYRSSQRKKKKKKKKKKKNARFY